MLRLYKLPGTKFYQQNDKSDGGQCLFSAVGNAVLYQREERLLQVSEAGAVDTVLPGRMPRNLQIMVRRWIAMLLATTSIRRVLIQNRGLWQDKRSGIDAVEDYLKIHINSDSPRQSWGTTLDIHLIALFLLQKGIENRIVVHTKNTNEYVVHHALDISSENREANSVIKQTRLEPSHVLRHDLVLINTGNGHWSRAEFHETAEMIAPLLSASEEEEVEEAKGVVSWKRMLADDNGNTKTTAVRKRTKEQQLAEHVGVLKAKESLLDHTRIYLYRKYRDKLNPAKRFADIQDNPVTLRGRNGYWKTDGRVFRRVFLRTLMAELWDYSRKEGRVPPLLVSQRQVTSYEILSLLDLRRNPGTSAELKLELHGTELNLLRTLLQNVLRPYFPNHHFVRCTLLATKPGIQARKWSACEMHVDFHPSVRESDCDTASLPLVMTIPLESQCNMDFMWLRGRRAGFVMPDRQVVNEVSIPVGGLGVWAADQFHCSGNPFRNRHLLKETCRDLRLNIQWATIEEHILDSF